jgi:hypothetical protein
MTLSTPTVEAPSTADREAVRDRSPRVTRRERDWVIALTVVSIALSLHLWSFRSPLLGPHDFRQTQTAFQAREFAEHGVDLLHPRLPVLGPPWEVPFEFPAFQALASVPIRVGLSADTSTHLTALACFAISAVLLFGLMRYVASRAAAFGALVAFALSPFALVWAGASLMEYLVTACVLAFLWAGIAWRDTGKLPLAIIAVTAASLGMAVKGTTTWGYLIPFVFYRSRNELPGIGDWLRTRMSPRVWALVAMPLVVGVVWTRHADAIKEASPATRWLTTSNLTDWNFGTLQQRLEGVNWVLVGDRIESLLVGRYFWAGLIIVAVIFAQRRAFWIGMALAVVLPVTVFFNLFFVHEYYLIAVTPGIAALLGLSTDLIWRHRAQRIPAVLVVLGLATVWLAPLYWTTKDYWRDLAFNPPKTSFVTAVAGAIRRDVPSNEPVVLQGLGWNPTTLYYAHRRGLMLDPRIATPAVADLLRSHGFRHWYAVRPTAPENDLLRAWPWIASTGRQAYRMSQTASRGLEDAALVATRDQGAIDAAWSTGQPLSPSAVEVRCDGRPHALPTAAPTTWLVLANAERRGVRISVDQSLAPIPGFPALVLRRDFADLGAPVSLVCTGGGRLSVNALAAPDPFDAGSSSR